ncbi:hypothetical protein NLG97_g8086 [Lecanicillium saksenae]|uniref:Uncharacterized protein n=1 Tax=Lecanicillium saksenae TaxID=468837 RepID=A0ACC1QLU7_9HYPO|nr:hypothetical protein NLG97_g8086 [Lecanicillium saksenae]
MPSRQVAALLATASLFSGTTPLETVEDASCGCFVSNGTNSGYYAKHAFFDFRQQSKYAGVPDVVEDAANVASAPVTSDFFKTDAWTSFWDIQTWDNNKGPASDKNKNTGLSKDATVYMINSASNIYIEKASNDSDAATFLTMRTKRLKDFQTAAEFQAWALESRASVQLEKVLELPTTSTADGVRDGGCGGRHWDVKIVKPKPVPGEAAPEEGVTEPESVVVMRPKVGGRVAGGGFIAVYRKWPAGTSRLQPEEPEAEPEAE